MPLVLLDHVAFLRWIVVLGYVELANSPAAGVSSDRPPDSMAFAIVVTSEGASIFRALSL